MGTPIYSMHDYGKPHDLGEENSWGLQLMKVYEPHLQSHLKSEEK